MDLIVTGWNDEPNEFLLIVVLRKRFAMTLFEAVQAIEALRAGNPIRLSNLDEELLSIVKKEIEESGAEYQVSQS